MTDVETTARNANSPDLWDRLWVAEGDESWRKRALSAIYNRIESLLPENARAVDFGGGRGILAAQLQDSDKKIQTTVVDHSGMALAAASKRGLDTLEADLESGDVLKVDVDGRFVVATEVCEHLSTVGRDRLFIHAKGAIGAMFSVPNDRLGPDEEPQHTIKFTAMSFKRELERFFDNVRVEVHGFYLLGVCGALAEKSFRMSVTMPARDEAEDLEATLASFRGVADEIVIGIDPRTKDNTREVAEKYADHVFDLVDPEGPPDDRVPDGGVHFAWIRNQCIDRCSGDWIFMSEAHERLVEGVDQLLALDKIVPHEAKVGFVLRSGGPTQAIQQWAFPWLFRNVPEIRFSRSTHNVLDFPEKMFVVHLPQIRTLHDRVHARDVARQKQRAIQNRKTLFEDWLVRGNDKSLFYLGSEWREHDPRKAKERLTQFLAVPSGNGPMRYHARLILAKLLLAEGNPKAAREILLGCTSDDWQRTEHWIWIGDLAFERDQFEEALQFYLYAAARCGEPPFTMWWIDTAAYSYLPAQRLAMTFSALGRLQDALSWAIRVRDLLPNNAPTEALEEADRNIATLKGALTNDDEAA